MRDAWSLLGLLLFRNFLGCCARGRLSWAFIRGGTVIRFAAARRYAEFKATAICSGSQAARGAFSPSGGANDKLTRAHTPRASSTPSRIFARGFALLASSSCVGSNSAADLRQSQRRSAYDPIAASGVYRRRAVRFVGYGVMTLLMTSTPLAMVRSDPFVAAASSFNGTWGRFAPSFATATLIRRVGHCR